MTGDDNYPVDIAVVLEDPAWGVEAESICRLAAAAALETAGCEGGDLCIVLSDNAHVASLNSRFRHLEGPTNVLAFAAGAPGLLGDVILARETTAEEARTRGKALAAHLSHLAVHGPLHFLGFGHQDDDEARHMEAMEVRVLATLGIADPYAAERVGVK